LDIVDSRQLDKSHKFFYECAKIHSQEIPDGFLPTLGLNFLSSLYNSFSKSKYSFLLLAVEDDKVVGFIAISIHTKNFFKWYIASESYKNLFRIPLSILSGVFFKKVIEVFKYPFSKKTIDKEFISDSEIFNFCVDSSLQGKGVGKLLFSKALDYLKDYKIQSIKIVTGSKQIAAQNFYYKSGAMLSHKIKVHDDEESLVFLYQLKEKLE